MHNSLHLYSVNVQIVRINKINHNIGISYRQSPIASLLRTCHQRMMLYHAIYRVVRRIGLCEICLLLILIRLKIVCRLKIIRLNQIRRQHPRIKICIPIYLFVVYVLCCFFVSLCCVLCVALYNIYFNCTNQK